MPESFVDSLKERAALVRQHSKRFSISSMASMGSMRWSYKSDRSEGTASTTSSVSSAPSSTNLSDTSSTRMYSSQLRTGPPRRHGKSPATGFEPLYLQKLRQDNERRLRFEMHKAQQIMEE